jgi:hypothetical protein
MLLVDFESPEVPQLVSSIVIGVPPTAMVVGVEADVQ